MGGDELRTAPSPAQTEPHPARRPRHGATPLLIEQVWPAQILDDQPNRFGCVPGQLITPGCGPAAIGSNCRASDTISAESRLSSRPSAGLTGHGSVRPPRSAERAGLRASSTDRLSASHPRPAGRARRPGTADGSARPRRSPAGRQADQQVGPPQRAIDDHELGGRLATSMRMRRQFPELDPGAVLDGGVVEVDLEPVPDDDRRRDRARMCCTGASCSLGAGILAGDRMAGRR